MDRVTALGPRKGGTGEWVSPPRGRGRGPSRTALLSAKGGLCWSGKGVRLSASPPRGRGGPYSGNACCLGGNCRHSVSILLIHAVGLRRLLLGVNVGGGKGWVEGDAGSCLPMKLLLWAGDGRDLGRWPSPGRRGPAPSPSHATPPALTPFLRPCPSVPGMRSSQ